MENLIAVDIPAAEEQFFFINTFGHSVTAPSHTYGPAVRPYYLLHYILKGKGEYHIDHNIYQLSAGQGFFIEPNRQTLYKADAQEPWTYIWIGFSGDEADKIINSLGLSSSMPIFRCDNSKLLQECIFNMLHHEQNTLENSYYRLSMFYRFISAIAASNHDGIPVSEGNSYVEQAISYIHHHIAEPMQVEKVARYVGLNRTYFCKIFKEHTGTSPLKYIQNFRLTKAQHLLESSLLPVETIAYSCGYQCSESLIRIFRRKYGASPAAYRKRFQQQPSPVVQVQFDTATETYKSDSNINE